MSRTVPVTVSVPWRNWENTHMHLSARRGLILVQLDFGTQLVGGSAASGRRSHHLKVDILLIVLRTRTSRCANASEDCIQTAPRVMLAARWPKKIAPSPTCMCVWLYTRFKYIRRQHRVGLRGREQSASRRHLHVAGVYMQAAHFAIEVIWHDVVEHIVIAVAVLIFLHIDDPVVSLIIVSPLRAFDLHV